MGKFLARFWWLILVVVGIGFFGYARSRPVVVEVVVPVQKTVVESIAATGRMRGQVETSVGATTSGRVTEVPVREGDHVKQGQIVARLDDSTLRVQVIQAENAVATTQAQVAQASDAITTAKAQLALASRPPLPSDIRKLKADTAQNVAVAEAKLAFAKQRLAELKEGATREERDQISAQVEQAKASLVQAERDLERQQGLLKEGAIAQSLFDSAQTTRDVAKRTLENLVAKQAQIKVGTRTEQVAQAEADVRAAQATVAGAKASGAAQLTTLLSTPRPEDVQVARVRVAESMRAKTVAEGRVREVMVALDVAKSRTQDTIVTAPFDGTVTQIVTETGGVTGPNQPIVRLIRWNRPEIRIDVDEVNLGKISIGQDAVVTSDAFPNDAFNAKIREIGAQVDADRGTVEVRLDPINPPTWLRPGQTISVNILVDTGTPRLVIPLPAVTTIGGASSVLVVENGVVTKKDIVVGAPGSDGIPVKEGLTAQSQVIVVGTGLTTGQTVQAKLKTATKE